MKLFGLRVAGDQLVERAGLRWVLDPSDYVQADLFWFGSKDMWEIRRLLGLVKKHDVIFDVGANFGYYSLRLAADQDRACQVYAFEPNPIIYNRLLKNREMNRLDNIRAYCLALSDHKGSAGISVKDHNSGLTQLVKGNGVALNTLDDFCLEQNIQRLDLMKIDVEGHEERVLRGGVRILNECKPTILLELNPCTLAAQSSDVNAVVSILAGFGYRLYEIRRDRLCPVSGVPVVTDYMNVLCVHTDKVPTQIPRR